MKILYVTTVAETMRFFPEHIKMLQEEGNVVELATNCRKQYNESVKDLRCKTYHIPFSRKVCSWENIKSYSKLKKLIKREKYDVVHTHTPNASVIVRIACKGLRKNGMKVLYTAHGFHFYKGAPVRNWIFFFPVEWVCAFWTDVLITINMEDYALAKRCIKAKRIEYIPGVGIDLEKFQTMEDEREIVRKELGMKQEDVMLFSAGELNHNKNHETVIRILNKIKDKRLHYFIAGQGPLFDYLKGLIEKLKLQKQVHLLGYRNDIFRLYQGADIYVLPSIREGLNVSLMEAMASGLPVICSRIRGNMDLVSHQKGGFLCNVNSESEIIEAMKALSDKRLRRKMGKFNINKIKKFEMGIIKSKLKNTYDSI